MDISELLSKVNRMSRNIAREKKGLSPVIATVILISVTIVVAVSVAYWMGSIASGYTTFEQIELPTSYARWDGNKTFTNGGWNITIELKNTGSADATIDNIFLNGIPLSGYSSSSIRLYEDGRQVPNLSSISISVTKGGSKTLLIQVEKYNATDNS
ncbi:type IV pilin, partial [Candidatus Bathyarchaeota archaeon]